MLLGALYAVVGTGVTPPRVVQAILGAVTTVLVFAIGARIGGRRAGWIAALLFAGYGPVLFYEGELLPVTFVLVATTGALLLLLEADATGRSAPFVAAAFLLGATTAARPTVLLLAAAVAVWWIRRPSSPRRAALAAIPAFLLPILPFTIANAVGGREAVLVSWNGGINFYIGNGANSDSLTAIQPGHAWDRLQVEPLRAGVRTRREESDYWVRRGLREAGADPGAWTAALGRKARRLLDARETPRNTDWEDWRKDSAILSWPWVGFGLVAPLAFVGLGVRGLPRGRGLLVASLVATAAVSLAFFVAERYRLEAVPALCALAGVGVDRLLRDGLRAAPVPALCLAAAGTIAVHADLLGEREVDEVRAAINRAAALRQLGRDEEAAPLLRRALAAAPGDPDANYRLGQIELAESDLDAALALFDRSLAGAPDYVRALLARAACLEKLGRRDEAEASYRRAIEIDPWQAETRLNYGVFLAVGGRKDDARREFRAGLAIDPTDGRLLRNLQRLEEGGS
jgi:hypothetical protein